ncbi:MAG TPA: N-acetylneuraminate synthase [Thermoanaerobaculia bacterium]|nr:N-acetylneuraminate synthase [Thermoanaerobaculia bacterium]
MSRVTVIAEAGVNHNGSPELALQLVAAAADAGADYVKFQTFRAESLVTRSAATAQYQAAATGDASQFEMLRRLELSVEAHHEVVAACRERGIGFISTPFDSASLRLLVDEIGVALLKIGSGDLTNAPLLLESARSQKPVILSTGMGTLGDIELALGVLAFGYIGGGEPSLDAFRRAYASAEGGEALRANVTLLQCTSEYPCVPEHVNLRAMDTLREAFGLATGFSDHTVGLAVPIAAAARGAAVIEKHFTLDKSLPGPDHKASLAPGELKAMVAAIREVELALGSARKLPTDTELATAAVARRSLVALEPIARGTAFTHANIGAKRPGTGLSPFELWEWIGRTADRDYDADELLGTRS